MGFLDAIFGNYSKRELARIEPIKQQVLDLETEYSNLSETELKAKTPEFKKRLAANFCIVYMILQRYHVSNNQCQATHSQ